MVIALSCLARGVRLDKASRGALVAPLSRLRRSSKSSLMLENLEPGLVEEEFMSC